MLSYETLRNQKSRLGEFQSESTLGEFGQTDAAAIVGSIGSTVKGVISSITKSQTLRQQSKDRRKTAIHVSTESRKKLGIQTEGAVEQAKVGVEKVKATYGSLTKLIIGGGTVLAGVIIAGALAYSLTAGDSAYSVEYAY